MIRQAFKILRVHYHSRRPLNRQCACNKTCYFPIMALDYNNSLSTNHTG